MKTVAFVSKLLTLIAVLLLPLGMTAAPAASAQHHSASMPGHCPGQKPNTHGKTGFTECTMACSAALPAMETRQDEAAAPVVRAPAEADLVHQLHGLHPETATPPPKLF